MIKIMKLQVKKKIVIAKKIIKNKLKVLIIIKTYIYKMINHKKNNFKIKVYRNKIVKLIKNKYFKKILINNRIIFKKLILWICKIRKIN